ncbi:hypothetical protein P8605_12420 [Streptomyces sp. T-3]|nr:hypothetical protein [Streptomyces sp. T-3]
MTEVTEVTEAIAVTEVRDVPEGTPVRELRNVREVPHDGTVPDTRVTPLTAEEELRVRAAFAADIGRLLVAQGRAIWPAYTPEERIRLYAIVPALSDRLGRPVHAEPQDACSVLFRLD